MGVIVYNDIASNGSAFTTPLVVQTPPDYVYPERDYEITHVEGRNGDIYIDKNSYKNVTRTYELAAGSPNADYIQMINQITRWLHSSKGYARLWDSYDPEVYRMAVYTEGQTITNIQRHAAAVSVQFNCKPQRYLLSGENPIIVKDNDVIKNPTEFTSKPLLKITGINSEIGLTIIFHNGTKYISLSLLPGCFDNGPIYVDCELQDAYAYSGNNAVNMNRYVQLGSEYAFPELMAGNTTITFTSTTNIKEMEVVPRWWTL